jgi:hypothetical protein
VRDPIVTVIVTGFVGPYSEQIRVVGEAARPQFLPYKKKMTLLDVMIAVGGLTDFAVRQQGHHPAHLRRQQAVLGAPEGPDQAWRRLGQRRDAPGRHPDHSAELLLIRRARSRCFLAPTGRRHGRTRRQGCRSPRHVEVPLAGPAAWPGWSAIIGVVVVFKIPDQYEASARIYVDTQSILKPLMAGLTVQPNVEQQVGMLSRTLISRPNIEKLIRMADLDLKTAVQGRAGRADRAT